SGLGGVTFMGLDQPNANSLVIEAIKRGVNYFDVGPSYGKGVAEQRMGIALEPYRDRIFLAEKTLCHDAAGAREEFEQSCRNLKTDHVELYQFHGVSSVDEVDKILAPGGAAATFLALQEQGRVRYLGASVHDEAAGRVLVDRFEALDSLLFPINFVCFAQGDFGPSLLEHARSAGVKCLALKALAHHVYAPEADRYRLCWYRPIEDKTLAERAYRWTLSQDVVAALAPGEPKFSPWMLEFGERFEPMDADEQNALMQETEGLEPIFPK
ncbi:MAG: aldo/keto reductase, partial [Planctomycetota bacterium]